MNMNSGMKMNQPAKEAVAFHAIDTNKLSAGDVFYQCGMHPEVITDHPGTCPKCGMELKEMHKAK